MARYPVGPAHGRARLVLFVAEAAGCSRAEARRLIEAGQVRVDGARGKNGSLLSPGQLVELATAPANDAARRPLPQPELPLVERYADEELLALDKPAGMPTHPLRAGERGTLANALVARHPECAAVGRDPREAGLAHRLDLDTSGLVLAARRAPIFEALRAAFSAGEVEKEYWALVAGEPPERGEIDAPLTHATRRTMRVTDHMDGDGRAAVTTYQRLGLGRGCALVRAVSHSGRMHQIRVHLASIGHPLVGDALYGGPTTLGAETISGHLLHAGGLSLPHPGSGAPLVLTAPWPADRAALLARLGLTVPGG